MSIQNLKQKEFSWLNDQKGLRHDTQASHL